MRRDVKFLVVTVPVCLFYVHFGTEAAFLVTRHFSLATVFALVIVAWKCLLGYLACGEKAPLSSRDAL